MAEVDSNLNYLLGRLSLVTQEFNQIKVGLGKALDNIKSSFEIVQTKIQGIVFICGVYYSSFNCEHFVILGPGPHKIQSEENETDYNLQSKADAQA